MEGCRIRRRGERARRTMSAGLGAAGLLAWAAWALPAGVAGAAATAPNDPFYPQQWNLTKVGAPPAWARSTGRGVVIGIVDTGVDLGHEDVADKVVATTDCIGANGDPNACTGVGQDDNGHGTHVAGIAAADTDNGRGIAGMAPGARLVVAKALDKTGSGGVNDINAGIEWVVDRGARVVNLSLGSDVPAVTGLLGDSSLSPGVEYAWSHGAIPVLASGNENFFGLGSSNYGNADAVVVGSTGPGDEVAPYSSPLGDAKWALVAPGGDGQDSSGNLSCDGSAQPACIVSSWWSPSGATNEYAFAQGTSMAAPMVSGTLALLLSEGLSPNAAVQRLLATTDRAVQCGSGCSGRLDAANAVGASAAAGGPAATGASDAPAPTTRAAAPRPVGASGPPTAVSPTSGAATVAPPPTGAPRGSAVAGGPPAFPGAGPTAAGGGTSPAVLAAGAAAATLALLAAGLAVRLLRKPPQGPPSPF